MLRDDIQDAFKTACANIILYSDPAWITAEPNEFMKANQELWVRYNWINNYYKEYNINKLHVSPTSTETRPRTVRDIIPFSRLAVYGNYEYNEDRELLYAPSNSLKHGYLHENSKPSNYNEEVWMSSEVEAMFEKLNCVNDERKGNL